MKLKRVQPIPPLQIYLNHDFELVAEETCRGAGENLTPTPWPILGDFRNDELGQVVPRFIDRSMSSAVTRSRSGKFITMWGGA